ncbi:acyltransferase family protein [Methylobacterium sp. J-067]|uniref:acyltransferase family protein n=1 Tax=Methylobacterium sp. J-067 TaxID=2836648 RepID=UPI00244385B6|nr:acyltransferase [Methylobacterium sp. J-067]
MSRSRSIISLDIARVFAAAVVLIYHFLFFSWVDMAGGGGIRDVIGVPLSYPEAVSSTWWGWVGVEIFFVISGFVISMSAIGKSASSFAVDRISRLYPALIFFSLLAFCVILQVDTVSKELAVRRLINTLILWPTGPWIDGVVWTLVTEAMFYIAITLIILSGRGGAVEVAARYALMVVTAFWIVVLLHVLVGFGSIGAASLRLATSFGARVMLLTTGGFFLLGMFGNEIYRKGLSAPRMAWVLVSLACCVMAIVSRAIGTHGVVQFHQNPAVPVVVWLSCLVVCVVAMVAETHRPPGRNVRAFARTLGLMTYPLYLVHEITGGWLLGRLAEGGLGRWGAAVLAGLIVLAISYVFAKWLEPWIRQALGFNDLARRVRLRSGSGG